MSEPPNAAVLVVDDVPENRDLLVRRLKRLGINDVEHAWSACPTRSANSGAS